MVKTIQDGKAKMVFLAHDAGPNLTKKIQDKSHLLSSRNCNRVFNTGIKHSSREIEKGFGCNRCWIYKENEVSYGIEEEDMICLRKDCTKSQKNLEKKVKKL